MVLLYEFLINGVNVTDYVLSGTKITLSRNNDSGNTANIILSREVENALSLVAGQEIRVSRGVITSTDNVKFKGNIKKIEVTSENNYLIRCKDLMHQLKYKLFTYSYDINTDSEKGEASAIFENIAVNGGFNVSTVSSGTATSDITLTKFISKKQSRLNRMNLISKILNWSFYYDYDNDFIRFEPKGFEVFTTPLIVGQNIVNTLNWEEDLETMRNNITVEGAFVLDTRSQSFTGDNTTTVFSLSYEPDTTDLSVDGTLQKRGAPESSGDYDYVVDIEKQTFTFNTAPSTSASIVMNYTTRIPMPVQSKSPSSISEYGLEQEEIYSFKDVVNTTDAETRANQLLDILKDAPVNTTGLTSEYDLNPGMKVTVEDPLNPARNDDYVVYSITINYPEPYDSVKIGSAKFNVEDLFRTIMERLNAIENVDSKMSEILRQIFSLFHNIGYDRARITNYTKTVSATIGIYGHPTKGVYGTSKYGSNSSIAWTEDYDEVYE